MKLIYVAKLILNLVIYLQPLNLVLNQNNDFYNFMMIPNIKRINFINSKLSPVLIFSWIIRNFFES